jgi:hypothetical protein
MQFTGAGGSLACDRNLCSLVLTYRLSYRDLVSLMAEREVHVTHTTIMRWVFQFVAEYERRWNRRARHPSDTPAGLSVTGKICLRTTGRYGCAAPGS